MQFAEIPGLDEIKKSLIASYEKNHIAHAQLFNSVEGGGALPLALAFSTFLLCSNKKEDDSCSQCPNCQKMSKLIHPDVHHFFPKLTFSKSSDIEKHHADTQKNWREFAGKTPFGTLPSWVALNGFDNKNMLINREESRRITKTVSMKSFEGDFKILLIWCPEYMNATSANGILKALEEPPTQTIYILMSHSYESLLPTIKSRVQLFNIPPHTDIEIQDYLVQNHGADLANARQVSKMSGGSLGKAMLELDSVGEVAYQSFQSWMRLCLSRDYTALIKMSEDFSKSSKPDQRSRLQFGLTLVREAILSQSGDESLISREGAEKEFIVKFGSAIPLEGLEGVYIKLSETLGYLARNASPKITFMSLSLSISEYLAKRAV